MSLHLFNRRTRFPPVSECLTSSAPRRQRHRESRKRSHRIIAAINSYCMLMCICRQFQASFLHIIKLMCSTCAHVNVMTICKYLTSGRMIKCGHYMHIFAPYASTTTVTAVRWKTACAKSA